MRTFLNLAASTALLAAIGTMPALAGESYGCHSSCTPTTIFTSFINSVSSVPDPTRNGIFIGHFDANGVPQSIVTQPDSFTVVTVIPCPEKKHRSYDT